MSWIVLDQGRLSAFAEFAGQEAMSKAKGTSALDKERAKMDALLRKVGYTALKDAGIKSKRPDLPILKIEKRDTHKPR